MNGNSTTTQYFDLQFPLSAAPSLRVLSFSGRESVSRLYKFDVRVALEQPAADGVDGVEALLLERDAALRIEALTESPRMVYGVVSRVRRCAGTFQDRPVYELRLVPRFWKLRHRKTSRIFQDKSTLDIARTIAAEHGVAVRDRLLRRPPVRGYCVQYQETDLEFVCRLLAEEGIFFVFNHPSAGGAETNLTSAGESEVLVLSDSAQYYPRLTDGSDFVTRAAAAPDALAPTVYDVSAFEMTRQIKPRGVLEREFDFLRPVGQQGDLALDDPRASASTSDDPIRRSIDVEPPATLGPQADLATRYDHEGEYGEAQIEPLPARIVLEQLRARVLIGRATSQCRHMMPGRFFALNDVVASAHTGEYVVLEVRHEGYAPEVAGDKLIYENRFECAPRKTRMRPPVPPRQLHQVTETATVMGPKGEEIYTDELGRIKVRFHWDREDRPGEKSSCWIRVAQSWAGASWGAQFIPRVGMEVLVTFLCGDADRPMVTGAVYNAIHPPPFVLPQQKTQSGWRTSSSPGGVGSNEIIFDDAAGGELIAIRSRKNLAMTALGDMQTEVTGTQRDICHGSRRNEVRGGKESLVAGDASVEIAGNASQRIAGSLESRVAQGRQVVVGGHDVVDVQGDLSVHVGGVARFTIGGDEPNSGFGSLNVKGVARINSTEELHLVARKRVKLIVGDSRIEISESSITLTSGTIGLGAGTINLAAGAGASGLALTSSAVLKGSTASVFSSGASLVLDGDAKLDGGLVMLNCAGAAAPAITAGGGSDETGVVTFTVKLPAAVTEKGSAILVVRTPTGELVEKPIDSTGVVQIEGTRGDIFEAVAIKQDGATILMRTGEDASPEPKV